MTEVQLAIDIKCDWIGYTAPIYRVYVDGDLLTERSYIWDGVREYVREHLLVNIAPGTHTLKIEPVVYPGCFATFTTANFEINKQPAQLVNNTFVI